MTLPCKAPGQEVPKGGKCHFLLRFSRDPAAFCLSGVLVLPRGSWRPSAAWCLRRVGEPPCSEAAPFFSEADDGPGKGKGEWGEAAPHGLRKFSFIPWVSDHLCEGRQLECDGGVLEAALDFHRG